MKKTKNLAIFILAFLAPIAVLLLTSSIFKFDVDMFGSMFVALAILWLIRVMAVQQNESDLWTIFSRSLKDKIVFAASLISFWIIFYLPGLMRIEMRYVTWISVAIGFLVAAIIIILFGSQTLKGEIFGKRNK